MKIVFMTYKFIAKIRITMLLAKYLLFKFNLNMFWLVTKRFYICFNLDLIQIRITL